MTRHMIHPSTAALAIALAASPAMAQTTPAPTAPPVPPPTQASASAAAPPDKLVVYFDVGSSSVRSQDAAVLDQASRLYRDGKPIVMILSGSTDATGAPAANLRLSATRAEAVLQGLVARGIPAERFQLLAKGQTDPAVQAAEGVAAAGNRRVEISWR